MSPPSGQASIDHFIRILSKLAALSALPVITASWELAVSISVSTQTTTLVQTRYVASKSAAWMAVSRSTSRFSLLMARNSLNEADQAKHTYLSLFKPFT